MVGGHEFPPFWLSRAPLTLPPGRCLAGEELQLATEECQDQRLRCQEEHRELKGACEAALNGLPLHFYEAPRGLC